MENNYNYGNVHKKTRKVIEDFLKTKKAEGRRKATLEEYEFCLKHMAKIIYEKYDNKSILKLSSDDFRDIDLYLQYERKCSNSRTNAIMNRTKRLLEFAADKDTYKKYKKNALKYRVSLVKKPVRKKVFLERKDVDSIIKYCVEINNLQLAVLISLAFDSGARIGELVQVEKHNLLDGNSTNLVERKGGKKQDRLLYMNDTRELIRLYLEQRGEDTVDSLFYVENKGVRRAASKKTISERIRRTMRRLGYEDVTVHTFRRSCSESFSRGTHKNMQELSLKQVQHLLGHDSQMTTEKYYLKDRKEEVLKGVEGLFSSTSTNQLSITV